MGTLSPKDFKKTFHLGCQVRRKKTKKTLPHKYDQSLTINLLFYSSLFHLHSFHPRRRTCRKARASIHLFLPRSYTIMKTSHTNSSLYLWEDVTLASIHFPFFLRSLTRSLNHNMLAPTHNSYLACKLKPSPLKFNDGFVRAVQNGLTLEKCPRSVG